MLQNNNLVNEEIREYGFISWGLEELFSGQNDNLTLNHQHLCQNFVCIYLWALLWWQAEIGDHWRSLASQSSQSRSSRVNEKHCLKNKV